MCSLRLRRHVRGNRKPPRFPVTYIRSIRAAMLSRRSILTFALCFMYTLRVTRNDRKGKGWYEESLRKMGKGGVREEKILSSDLVANLSGLSLFLARPVLRVRTEVFSKSLQSKSRFYYTEENEGRRRLRPFCLH